jgi:hypothetical protein
MSTSRRGDFPKDQKELRATTAERLEAIVEAAERAAESVIDDAEAQAHRYLAKAQAQAQADRAADRRLTDLAATIDALLGQAALLRREAERMQAVLEQAKLQLGTEGSTPAAEENPAPEEFSPPAEAPRLRAIDGADEEPAAEAKPADAAGARLLATQMAVSGSSREEIEARLRNRFEIEDTTPILDAILGPEE